jgi:hypothetical protein
MSLKRKAYTDPDWSKPVARKARVDPFCADQRLRISCIYASTRQECINWPVDGVRERNDSELELQWMRYFEHLNEERTTYSATDGGMIAICWTHACANSNRVEATPLMLIRVWHRLAVWACQHTTDSRAFWPSEDDMHLMWGELAAVVTQYFDLGLASLPQLVERLQQMDLTKAIDAQLDLEYQTRMEPLSLVRSRSRQRADAEEKHARGETVAAEQETAESARGDLWARKPLQIVQGFLSFAARVMREIMWDGHIGTNGALVRTSFPTKNDKMPESGLRYALSSNA